MLFQSKLPELQRPSTDTFNFVFHKGRRSYCRDRVLYKVDETGETLTLAQLEEKSERLGRVLIDTYSIKPGHVVAILATNSLEYVVANFAILAAGAVVAPIPIQKDLDHLGVASRLVQVKARLLFTNGPMLRIAEHASDLAGTVPIITFDDVDPHTPHVGTLIEQSHGRPSFHLNSDVEAEKAVGFINCTSGSTGKSKSVLTSHAHFIAVLDATRATVPKTTDPDSDVWLATLSLGFFICGKLFMALNILLGIPVIIKQTPFDAADLEIVNKHKITFLFITPPLAANLAKANQTDVDLSSIKWLLTAGAPMHTKLREAVEQQLNGVHLTLEWGTTETLLLALQVDKQSHIPGSSGTLINGVEAKVIDIETGEELGPNQEGEILVRNSLCRFMGYREDDVANRDFDTEGFFHTGDVGQLDEHCNVFIKDRLKELLRVGDGYGSRISASELESVLFDHPAVGSAIVVGVRNEMTQIDHPTAFIVLKPGYVSSNALAAEIENYTASILTGLKRLSGGVFFVPKYPTVGFKIDRRTLKGMINIESGRYQELKTAETAA